ncbi:MAG: adenylate/guanylate cyclase domain-containing protein [Stappiaceae bacterium]
MRFRLMPTLLGSLATLIFLAVGASLAINYFSGRKLITNLGGRIIELNLNAIGVAVDSEVEEAYLHIEVIARSLMAGEQNLIEVHRLADFLKGTLAAEKGLNRVYVLNDKLKGFGVSSTVERGKPKLYAFSEEHWPAIEKLARQALTGHGQTIWDGPFFDPLHKDSVLLIARSFLTPEKASGVVVGAFDLEVFSSLMRDLSGETGSVSFILDDTGQFVAAHPLLADSPIGFSSEMVLPAVDELGDPILVNNGARRAIPGMTALEEKGITLEGLTHRGELYFLATQDWPVRTAATNIKIGTYRRASENSEPFEVLLRSMGLGLAVLLLALVAVFLMSRAITRPIRAAAHNAGIISKIEFDDVTALPGSVIREMDDLSKSLNGMMDGLQAFSRYVPKKLVSRLVSENLPEDFSEDRELTVMFTDIVGFTGLCEGMNARDTAHFINEHLTLLWECITEEGGTVDKYIGDAVMAFWGAPEAMDDHADAAARAVLRIIERVNADNAVRRKNGRPAVRMRIGIHSGPLVVGNIGAPERMNYTVIGDTVNVASRLENSARDIDRGDMVTAQVSAESVSRFTGHYALEKIGSIDVKGRTVPIETYRLSGSDE